MGDALERAIVSFVVQGEGLVNQSTDKIEVDLTSVERAGRSAETAARSSEEAARKAEQSAKQLVAGITYSLGKMHQAASLVRQAAEIAGFDRESRIGVGLNVAAAGFEGAARGASLGATIGSFVPGVGTAVGGVVGSVVGGGVGAIHAMAENEKRLEDAAKRGAEKAVRDSAGRDGDDAIGAMLREAGLAKFSTQTYGGSRQ